MDDKHWADPHPHGALARKAGASAEELYDVAERSGCSRAELDALLVDPVASPVEVLALSTVRDVEQPEHNDVEALVEERDDLVERIERGDPLALVELLEHTTGAKARSVKVTVPRPGASAAGD